MLFLLIFLYSLVPAESQPGGVPMQTTQYAYPGYIKFTTQFIMPTVGQTFPPSMSATIAFGSAYPSVPIVMASICQLSWTGMLTFNFTVQAITNTNFVLALLDYSKTDPANSRIIVLRFLIGVWESQRYTQTSETFEWIQNSPFLVSQNIPITNHELYVYPILVAYQDYYDPVIFTNPASVSTPSLTQTQFFGPSYWGYNTLNWITDSTKGYMIQKMKYVMSNLTITLEKFPSYYMSVLFAGNGLYVYYYMLTNNENNVPNNHFYGLHTLRFVQSKGNTAYMSIFPYLMSNTQFFLLSVVNYYNRCPLAYPYYVEGNFKCYTACPTGFYLEPESLVINNFYKCQTCSPDCATCVFISNNCTSCYAPYRLSDPDPVNGMVYCLCPLGQYGNIPSCFNCNSTMPYCAACTLSYVCEACQQSMQVDPISNSCACPPSTTQQFKTITYTVNSVTYTVQKPLCIRAIIAEDCNVGIDNPVLPANSGLAVFGWTCQCQIGGVVINNRCV